MLRVSVGFRFLFFLWECPRLVVVSIASVSIVISPSSCSTLCTSTLVYLSIMSQGVTTSRCFSCCSSWLASTSLASLLSSGAPVVGPLFLYLWCRWIPNVRIFEFFLIIIILGIAPCPRLATWLLNEDLVAHRWLIERM